MEVKDIIREKRLEKNLTMKELANLVGVSEATISRWESGDIENMKRDKISALVKVLGIPLEVIMEWEDGYYLNPETANVAQEIFDNPDLRALFDAGRDSKPEDLRMAADLLTRLKETNRDG